MTAPNTPNPFLARYREEAEREVRTKPTIVAGEDGEWIWARRPTPEQDAAWIDRQHKERDALLSLARTLRSNAHQYRRFGMADKAAEAWDRARWSLQQAKIRNV